MLRTSVIVLCLSSLALGLLLPEELKNKVIGVSYLKACMGEKNFEFIHEKTVATIKECQMKEPLFTDVDIFGHALPPVTPAHPELPPVAADPVARHDDDEEHDLEHLMESLHALKVDKIVRLSNLTCVMTSMGFWNEDKTINTEFWTKGKWEALPEPMPEEFVEHFNKKVDICQKIADVIPEPKEDDLPFKKTFGKLIFFQKCIMKKKCDLCTVKILKEMVEKMYGPMDEAKLEQLHLPVDNAYEATVVAMMAKFQSLPETVKAVKKFMFEGDLY
jgi:hypothetical protein